EQVHVARSFEKRVETPRPFVARDRLRARPVDELDRRAAFQRDRRGGHPGHHQLAPAIAERTATPLPHVATRPAGTPAARAAGAAGGGRRRNAARGGRWSGASGAGVGSARATAAMPACHSRPCIPVNGLRSTTWPLATQNEVRVPSSSPGTTTHTSSERRRRM